MVKVNLYSMHSCTLS